MPAAGQGRRGCGPPCLTFTAHGRRGSEHRKQERSYAAPDSGDKTGRVAAWRPRIAWVGAEHVEHIAEVEPHRVDAKQELALLKWLSTKLFRQSLLLHHC